jgi:flagellar assembly protein FliH
MKAARAKAAELLKQAVHEAEKLREQARAEGAAVGRREGHAAGLEEGRAQGLREERARAEAAAADALQSLHAAVEAFARERTALHHAAERDLLKLACAIAGRIARAEIARDPEVIRRTVHDLLVLSASRRGLVLRVNPEDEQALRTYLPELGKIFADLEGASITADAAVARGGCLASLPTGSVDATIETQLDQIERALLGEAG